MAPPHRVHGKSPSTRPPPRASAKITPEQLEAIDKELETLPGLIRTHYTKWTAGARDFQLDCMKAQKRGTNVILHAATGSGKTGIAAGPHLLPSSKGKVTLMVSPLLSLHDEQVSTFRDEFGLKATAINSSNGGCTKDIMEKVVAGEWQIVMLSPEMLLSRRFIDGVLRKSAFGSRCLSVFIDEAHCVSHWGASFRKKYASIGLVRAFLPRTTPIIAVTATLTPRVHDDLVMKLQFDPKDYYFCSVGNDRANVSQVIRAMQHPANSHRDLDFMVREGAVPEDIKLAFLYTDDIKEGGQIIDHLNARVSPAFRNRGLVRPYSAAMSREYREHVMALFRAGIVRILVCTDAAGMGCDLPNIELVVQWKAPKNLSSWVQRAGRAARASGRFGMAVMLVEKSAFEVSPLASSDADTASAAPTAAATTRGRGRGRGRGGRGGTGQRGGKKQGKDYAELHGQRRGWFTGNNDSVPVLDDASAGIPADAPAEGLYSLIQATICRRLILALVFKNKPSTAEKEVCCDICNPKLFDAVRPSKPVKAVRQKGIRKVPPVDSVRQALFTWRRNIKNMHYSHAIFAPNAILDDATCELLASIGPVASIEPLKQLLESSWSRWEELGNRLFAYMKSLDIPSYFHPPIHPSPFASPAYSHPPSFASFPSLPPSQHTPYAPQQTHASAPYGHPHYSSQTYFPGPSSSPMPPNLYPQAYANGPSPPINPSVSTTPQSQGAGQTTESPHLAPPQTQPHIDPDWEVPHENFYYGPF
ncbi:P-loop containing nucleoside triphosphate hydrolase protein [Mycena crocata]|nr:P-loop containing nucleoside triphosphate hydrolase protein [Mycena crocata]